MKRIARTTVSVKRQVTDGESSPKALAIRRHDGCNPKPRRSEADHSCIQLLPRLRLLLKENQSNAFKSVKSETVCDIDPCAGKLDKVFVGSTAVDASAAV